jgi:hypothetical protein
LLPHRYHTLPSVAEENGLLKCTEWDQMRQILSQDKTTTRDKTWLTKMQSLLVGKLNQGKAVGRYKMKKVAFNPSTMDNTPPTMTVMTSDMSEEEGRAKSPLRHPKRRLRHPKRCLRHPKRRLRHPIRRLPPVGRERRQRRLSRLLPVRVRNIRPVPSM